MVAPKTKMYAKKHESLGSIFTFVSFIVITIFFFFFSLNDQSNASLSKNKKV